MHAGAVRVQRYLWLHGCNRDAHGFERELIVWAAHFGAHPIIGADDAAAAQQLEHLRHDAHEQPVGAFLSQREEGLFLREHGRSATTW